MAFQYKIFNTLWADSYRPKVQMTAYFWSNTVKTSHCFGDNVQKQTGSGVTGWGVYCLNPVPAGNVWSGRNSYAGIISRKRLATPAGRAAHHQPDAFSNTGRVRCVSSAGCFGNHAGQPDTGQQRNQRDEKAGGDQPAGLSDLDTRGVDRDGVEQGFRAA